MQLVRKNVGYNFLLNNYFTKLVKIYDSFKTDKNYSRVIILEIPRYKVYKFAV